MSDTGGARPRARAAEARRNHASLLQVATRLFATASGPVASEAIAREAGVGIATLYRHFPTREALVHAVYEREIGRLRDDADRLITTLGAAAAPRAWTRSFAEWATTKHGMTDALGRMMASGRLDGGRMRAELVDIVELLLDAGRRTGSVRPDVDASDVAALLAGVLAVSGAPDDRRRTERLLDLVVDGLRPV